MLTLAFPTPGALFGKYKIVQELGRGSMGVVYLAEDGVLGRRVALKALSAALSMDLNFKNRFRLEARSIAAVNHAHVVRVHNLAEIDGLLIIDMEYLEGGDLHAHLKRGASIPEVAQLGAQVLDALAACHRRDIIHRDIKPSNILIDENGAAKVTDFGLAKILESHMELSIATMRSSGFFLGTPRYAPPEAWDAAEPDETWDIYSLGVVLYEALSGAAPYQATTPMSLVKEMAEKNVAPLRELAPGVSPEFAALVDRMISVDSTARPATAYDALQELAGAPEFTRAADVGAATVMAPRPRPRGRTGTKRGPIVRSALAAMLTVGAIVGLTFAAWQDRTRAILDTPVRGDSIRPTPPTERQVEAHAAAVVGAEQLAAYAKFSPDTWRAYDALMTPGEGDYTHAQALWLQGDDSTDEALYIISADSLCVLRPAHHEDRIELEGSWGQLAGPAGSILRTGNVDGVVRDTNDGQLLAGSLEFTDERVNHRWRVQLSLAAATTTDTAVLLAFERSDTLPALLYNELMPRARAWAMQFERLLPALDNARATPVDISGQPAPQIDGRKNEALWLARPAANDGQSVLPGVPLSRKGRLVLRQAADTLFLGVSVPGWPSQTVHVEVAIQPGVEAPNTQSPRVMFMYDSRAGSLAVEDVPRGEMIDAAGWQCAATISEGTLDLEMAIDLSRVSHGAPWGPVRLNVQVRASEAEEPFATWGHSDIRATAHGVLIAAGNGR